MFFVIDGEMDIHFRDGKITLREGDLYVVPKGVEHRPFAAKECQIMLIEPAGTLNTGDAVNEKTATSGVWI
jgi:mannose-6-phosphate isomerase-like protein (cupin superfamily)